MTAPAAMLANPAAMPKPKIAIRIARPWRWQLALVGRLRAAGHPAWIVRAPAAPLPAGLGLLLSLERMLYGIAGEHPADLVPANEMEPVYGEAEQEADFVFDLAGAEPDGFGVTFDGVPGEHGLLAALLDGRSPRLVIIAPDGAALAEGLPAIEDPAVLTRALGCVFARLADLIERVIRDGGRPARPCPATAPAASAMRGAAGFLARGIGSRLSARMTRLLTGGPRWCIGWRRTEGGSTFARMAWPEGGYRRLPGTAGHFEADPFLIVRDDVTHLFYEDFPYRTGKGVIAAVTLGPDGPSAPRVVLEQPYHLSYPFLFEEGGEVWMIPESSASGRIELYRAGSFPDAWELHAVLVDGISASDATLVRHGGRYWLFAATAQPHGSSWDALSLFHAERLCGPWTAHPANPVLIDASAARPAGAMAMREGRLLRVAQDCRGGYGAGLAFARVDRLDPEGYAQSVLGRLGPAPGWRAQGVHSLNRAGGFEAIDFLSERGRP